MWLKNIDKEDPKKTVFKLRKYYITVDKHTMNKFLINLSILFRYITTIFFLCIIIN